MRHEINLRKAFGSCLLLFCFLSNAWSQNSVACNSSTPLKHNSSYYNSQRALYQQWLDLNGLGKYLIVHSIGVQSNQVTLYLEIENDYTDQKQKADYAVSVWRKLRTEFKAINGIDLETQLLLKALYILDLEICQATITLSEIYGKPESFFKFNIKYKKEQITSDSTGTMSIIKSYPIFISGIATTSSLNSKIDRLRAETAKNIFDGIYDYFKQKFRGEETNIEVNYNNPRSKSYSITIRPVYNQVLKNQKSSLICEWLKGLGFECTSQKKEELTFGFYFKIKEGIRYLVCDFDAKIEKKESKLDVVASLEKASDSILLPYGKTIIPDLVRYLEKKKY